MTKVTSSKTFAYFLTAVSVLALLFLAISIWFLKIAWLEGIFAATDLTGQEAAVTQSIFDDPLITTVPKDQQSSQQKSKVFISSLDPVLGERSAKVYVIFYGSLLDSNMQNYLGMVDDLTASYAASDVAVVWKNYIAEGAAEADIACVNEQGKFWEYARALPNRSGDDAAAFQTAAAGVGAATSTLDDCVTTAGYPPQIQQSYFAGINLGVNNTHTLFINDRLYAEAITLDQIKQAIDEILASYQ